MRIATAVYPVLPYCYDLGITLSWCEAAPYDLDLYLFLPGTGQQSDAIYWGKMSHQVHIPSIDSLRPQSGYIVSV